MPGSIGVSVLEAVDLPAEATAVGKYVSVKVSVGKREFQTKPSRTYDGKTPPWNSDFTFPVLNLRDPLVISLLDSKGNQVAVNEIEALLIVERGFHDEFLTLKGGGSIHLRLSFVLTKDERRQIEMMRAAALRRREQKVLKKNSDGQGSETSIGTGKSPLLVSTTNKPLVLRENEDKDTHMVIPVSKFGMKSSGSTFKMEKVVSVCTNGERERETATDSIIEQRKDLDFDSKRDLGVVSSSPPSDEMQNVILGSRLFSDVHENRNLVLLSKEEKSSRFLCIEDDLSSFLSSTSKETGGLVHCTSVEFQLTHSSDLLREITPKQAMMVTPLATMVSSEIYFLGDSMPPGLLNVMNDDLKDHDPLVDFATTSPVERCEYVLNPSMTTSESLETQSSDEGNELFTAFSDAGKLHMYASRDGSVSPTPLIDHHVESLPPLDLGVLSVEQMQTSPERVLLSSTSLVCPPFSLVTEHNEQGLVPKDIVSEKKEFMPHHSCSTSPLTLGEGLDSVSSCQLSSFTPPTLFSSILQAEKHFSNVSSAKQRSSGDISQKPSMELCSKDISASDLFNIENSSEIVSISGSSSLSANILSSPSTYLSTSHNVKMISSASFENSMKKGLEEVATSFLQTSDGLPISPNSVKAKIRAFERTFSQDSDHASPAFLRSQNNRLQSLRSIEKFHAGEGKKADKRQPKISVTAEQGNMEGLNLNRETDVTSLLIQKDEMRKVTNANGCVAMDRDKWAQEKLQMEENRSQVRLNAQATEETYDLHGELIMDVLKRDDSNSLLFGTVEDMVGCAVANKRQDKNMIADTDGMLASIDRGEGVLVRNGTGELLTGETESNNYILSGAGKYSASSDNKGNTSSSSRNIFKQVLGGFAMIAIGALFIWAHAGNKNLRRIKEWQLTSHRTKLKADKLSAKTKR
eukprot:c26940_g1_i2 orf=529-3282(-)